MNVNQAPPAAPAKQKSPFWAAIGSFFFPGLGQVYNGEGMLKGLLYFIGVFIGSIIFIIPGLAIWVYGIYNAYKVAEKVNLGQIPYKDVTLGKCILYIVLLIVIELVIMFILIMFSALLMAFIFAASSGTSSYSSY